MQFLLDIRRDIDKAVRDIGILKENQEKFDSAFFNPSQLSIPEDDLPLSAEDAANAAFTTLEQEKDFVFTAMINHIGFLRACLYVTQAEIELGLRQVNSRDIELCKNQDDDFLHDSFKRACKHKDNLTAEHRFSEAHENYLTKTILSLADDVSKISEPTEALQSMSIAQLNEAIFRLRAYAANSLVEDVILNSSIIDGRHSRISVLEKALGNGLIPDESSVRDLIEGDRKFCRTALKRCETQMDRVEVFMNGLYMMGKGIASGDNYEIVRYAPVPLKLLTHDYS